MFALVFTLGQQPDSPEHLRLHPAHQWLRGAPSPSLIHSQFAPWGALQAGQFR
uniref:Uncharacterized protein n=1 Tax=Anguilla anguilla TaxID=7936 RepID=A0A0E9WZX9_ANGAN